MNENKMTSITNNPKHFFLRRIRFLTTLLSFTKSKSQYIITLITPQSDKFDIRYLFCKTWESLSVVKFPSMTMKATTINYYHFVIDIKRGNINTQLRHALIIKLKTL